MVHDAERHQHADGAGGVVARREHARDAWPSHVPSGRIDTSMAGRGPQGRTGWRGTAGREFTLAGTALAVPGGRGPMDGAGGVGARKKQARSRWRSHRPERRRTDRTHRPASRRPERPRGPPYKEGELRRVSAIRSSRCDDGFVRVFSFPRRGASGHAAWRRRGFRVPPVARGRPVRGPFDLPGEPEGPPTGRLPRKWNPIAAGPNTWARPTCSVLQLRPPAQWSPVATTSPGEAGRRGHRVREPLRGVPPVFDVSISNE